MSSLIVFLAPLALAASAPLPAEPAAGGPVAAEAGAGQGSAWRIEWGYATAGLPPMSALDPQGRAMWRLIADAFRAPAAEQVRIEQRLVIRVVPRGPARDFLADLPDSPRAGRMRERKVGKCLPAGGIAGVEIGEDDRLLLFMRDQRLISASLEKACRARDFYSGFYVERNRDGQLCIDRDMLHSRTGSSCSLSRLRQLVAADD